MLNDYLSYREQMKPKIAEATQVTSAGKSGSEIGPKLA
jgi:hypothetical protein